MFIACKKTGIRNYDRSRGPIMRKLWMEMTGVGGGQTVVSHRCVANQWNIVCQSNNALKAINGAGNGGFLGSGIIFLTRLEKSDLSRDFFSCLDCDSDRKVFLDFFWFSLKIFCENGGRTSHLGWNCTENRLGAFVEPVGTSNSVVSCHLCLKPY